MLSPDDSCKVTRRRQPCQLCSWSHGKPQLRWDLVRPGIFCACGELIVNFALDISSPKRPILFSSPCYHFHLLDEFPLEYLLLPKTGPYLRWLFEDTRVR